MVPETITQAEAPITLAEAPITPAEAPITPKGLCTSTVQERRSLMGTVSAAGWPFSEGMGWRHPHLRRLWQYSSITEPRLPAIAGGVWGGVGQGRETGLTPPVHTALSHPQGQNRTHSTTVLMRLYSYFILSSNAALKERWRAQENQQHSRGGNSIHVIHGQRDKRGEQDHRELSCDSARLHQGKLPAAFGFIFFTVKVSKVIKWRFLLT